MRSRIAIIFVLTMLILSCSTRGEKSPELRIVDMGQVQVDVLAEQHERELAEIEEIAGYAATIKRLHDQTKELELKLEKAEKELRELKRDKAGLDLSNVEGACEKELAISLKKINSLVDQKQGFFAWEEKARRTIAQCWARLDSEHACMVHRNFVEVQKAEFGQGLSKYGM